MKQRSRSVSPPRSIPSRTRSRTDERYASVSPREGSGKSQRLSWGMAAESYRESPSVRSGALPPAWRRTHFSWNHVTCPISHIKGLTIRSWGPMSCSSDRSATNSSVLKRASLTQEARIASLSTVTSPGACRKVATLHLPLLKPNKILTNQQAPGNSGHPNARPHQQRNLPVTLPRNHEQGREINCRASY